MQPTKSRFKPTLVSMATAYEDQTVAVGVLEEGADLSAFDATQLAELRDRAVSEFSALHTAHGTSPTQSQVDAMARFSTDLDAIRGEIAARATRAEQAAAFATNVASAQADATAEAEAAATAAAEVAAVEAAAATEAAAAEVVAEVEPAAAAVAEPAAVTASASRAVSRQSVDGGNSAPAAEAGDIRSVLTASASLNGMFAAGDGISLEDAGSIAAHQLGTFHPGSFDAALKSGTDRREVRNVLALRRNFAAGQIVTKTNSLEDAMEAAADVSRLETGALTASGAGWSAPSPVSYDLVETETSTGLFDAPEINLERGGLQFTPGPDFSTILANNTGFQFTEQDEKDGKFQPGASGNVVGPKPVHRVPTPAFQDVRMKGDGLHIQAGLMQNAAWPELVARTIRGALVARAHRSSGLQIGEVVAGSTAVNMPGRIGATAAILNAIELQVTHYRAKHKLAPNQVLEGLFPNWTHALIRHDLALQSGVSERDISDEQINAWFDRRGLRPQFVYGWQGIESGTAASFTAWPTEIKFAIYLAGTWVRSIRSIVTLDVVYDTALLAKNDYSALFIEDGFAMIKRGHDSRVVTVGLSANGARSAAVAMSHSGTAAAGA